MRKPAFCIYAKTKTQISFAVTAKLISAFVFATRIVQSLYFLNPEFQASSHLLWLYSPVCVGPGLKPRRPVFSQRGSFIPRVCLIYSTQSKVTVVVTHLKMQRLYFVSVLVLMVLIPTIKGELSFSKFVH